MKTRAGLCSPVPNNATLRVIPMVSRLERLVRHYLPHIRGSLAHWRANVPGDCPLCGARALGGRLCQACEQAFTSLTPAFAASGAPWRCIRCALPLPEHNSPCPDCADRKIAFDRTVIAFDYIPPADALVLQMKRGKRYARADLLGNLLAEAVRHAPMPLSPDTVLIPTPSSSASLRERGFNPAAEIARALSRDLGLQIRHDLVWRNREQTRQSSRHRLERLQAVQGLYACSPSVAKMQVGLVDDVMTTGSTLHEIALTLKRAGAVSVIALVAARTPHMPEKSMETTVSTGFFRK